MQESDTGAFERVFNRLCAGFDTPPTPARKDAYWRSFRKLSLLEFTGLIDIALIESTFSSMPTVGALWELHHKNSDTPKTVQAASGPTLQEQLAAYVTRQVSARLTPAEFSRPGTYVYREWREGDKRCAELKGIVIHRDDGTRLGFTVMDMRAAEQDFADPTLPLEFA